MAYAISALLETPLGGQDTGVKSENVDPNNTDAIAQQSEAAAARLDLIQGRLHDNFWVAYDALDLRQNNMPLLKRGIELAKEMQ